MSNEQPKEPVTAEENPNAKYLRLQPILDMNWIKRNKLGSELLLSAEDEQMIFDCMQEYAAYEVAKAVGEKDTKLNRWIQEYSDLQNRNIELVEKLKDTQNRLERVDWQHIEDYTKMELQLQEAKHKISVLEANVLASVARDEAAEKMAEALDKIKQAFKIIGNDSVVELCGTALSSRTAAKEGGNNAPH